MKKSLLVMCMFGSALMLAACGAKKEKVNEVSSPSDEYVSDSKTKKREKEDEKESLKYDVTLTSGHYIDIPVGTTSPYETAFVITLDVENLSDSTQNAYGESFALKNDADEIIEVYEYQKEGYMEGYDKNIEKKRTQPRRFVFYNEDISKGEGEYTLLVRNSKEDEWQDTKVEVVLADYEKTREELAVSEKAFQAFLELSLYGKESQALTDYVLIDQKVIKNANFSRWQEAYFGLGGLFTFYKATAEEKQEAYNTFTTVAKKRHEIKVEKVYDDLVMAEYKISGKMLQRKNVVSAFQVFTDQNAQDTGHKGVTTGVYEKEVIGKLSEAMSVSELKNFDEITIKMNKVDDKWEFENDNTLFNDLAAGEIRE